MKNTFSLSVVVLFSLSIVRADVTLLRAPNEGIQPQAAADDKGNVHLIYLKGEPKHCNVFYVRRAAGKEEWSHPIRVNSIEDSAVAMGTMRGAHISLGKNNRVHVAWNGSGKTAPHGTGHMALPMLYTRLKDDGSSFEPERNLMTSTVALDGGGSVAADPQGNVYVVWHAAPKGNEEGEAGRAVFVARSTDDGKTFGAEKKANTDATGTCGCCGLRAFADKNGNLYALYRTATEMVNRDMKLLISKDRGASFQLANAQAWKVATCPASSASLAVNSTGALAAWETAGQVYFAPVNQATNTITKPTAAPGNGNNRKHPVVVGNARGETLLVWTEGTAWQRGGSLAWQIFDKNGQPTAEKGARDGIPVWSLATAFATADGRFYVVY